MKRPIIVFLPDFKHLSSFQDSIHVFFVNLCFSCVHVFEEDTKDLWRDVFENDDRIIGGSLFEERAEVWGDGGQHGLVGREGRLVGVDGAVRVLAGAGLHVLLEQDLGIVSFAFEAEKVTSFLGGHFDGLSEICKKKKFISAAFYSMLFCICFQPLV